MEVVKLKKINERLGLYSLDPKTNNSNTWRKVEIQGVECISARIYDKETRTKYEELFIITNLNKQENEDIRLYKPKENEVMELGELIGQALENRIKERGEEVIAGIRGDIDKFYNQ